MFSSGLRAREGSLIRAYDGINVLQHATIFSEPSYTPGYSASNLLRMNPRTGTPGRTPNTGSIDQSCSIHTGQTGQTSIITFKLDKPYIADAILVLGTNYDIKHISEFQLYVGYDSDYQNNTPCPGGPFAVVGDPLTSAYGTYSAGFVYRGTDWINGVETWCNLDGVYVSFVREATAQPPLDEIILCNFGVIGTPCPPTTVAIDDSILPTLALTHNVRGPPTVHYFN